MVVRRAGLRRVEMLQGVGRTGADPCSAGAVIMFSLSLWSLERFIVLYEKEKWSMLIRIPERIRKI